MNIKKALFIIGAIVGVVIIATFAISVSMKASLEQKISRITGLPSKINSAKSGYLLKIEGLKVNNPEGFANDTMLDICSVTIDKNLGEMEVKVREILVEKSPTGRVNIDYLKPDYTLLQDLKINKLKMHIDKVRYKGADGKETVYDVKIDKEYKNLPNPGSVADIIVSVGVGDTTLPQDENINPPNPPDPVDDIIDDGQDIPETTQPPGDGDEDQPDQPSKPGWTGGCH